MEIKSTEFFKNIKKLPPPGSDEFRQLIKWEEEKIKGGVTINGVYISGWLYWHINHWWIRIDEQDEYGNDIRVTKLPELRDNEWIRAEILEECKKTKKGYMEIGARQGGKSEMEASYFGMNATLFENTQNVIVCGNDYDLSLLKDKVDFGMKNLWKGIAIPRLDKTWRSNQIRLGYKKPDGEDAIWSYIVIRNAKDGNVTEVAAGTTAKSFIMDEALHEDSILYTSTGTKTIRDIQIGEKIYGKDGNLTTVVDKINPGIVDTYRITLLDGREVIASDNHLWEVYNVYRKKYLTLTTKDIREKYFFEKRDKRYDKTVKSFIYSLSINDALNFPQSTLPIDPYWLGLWLGDGHSDKTAVCSIDKEIISYCKEYAETLNLSFSLKEYKEGKHEDFRTAFIINKKGHLNPLREKLRELGIFNDKTIPESYLYSSYDQRLALLQGLMDTDGSCDSKGHLEFGTSIPKLAKTFEFLCRSLGIALSYKKVFKSYTHKGEKKLGKEHWRFALFTELPIFKLQRKLDNTFSRELKAYQERVSISNIEYVGKHQTYCIKVDNTDKLFLTDNFIVAHNCGKYPFASTFKAAEPAFKGKNGWRAVPVVVGTGGSFDKGQDAENFFYNPRANNFHVCVDPDTGKETGLFLSGLYRQDCKIITSLGDWLIKERGITLPKNSDLFKMEMHVADKELAKLTIEKERIAAKLNPDRTIYLKQIMYYPLIVEECFLSSGENIFDIEGAKRQKTRLQEADHSGTPVILYEDGDGVIKHEFTDKEPISNFPTKKDDNKDAPIIIHEFPVENPPYGLYVAGVDPYRQGKAAYSSSLGSVYIYKRMHSISGEKYQDMFVATYCARPDRKETWEEQARLLIKFYNARTLCENDEISFIDYMISKGDARYLERQPIWLQEIVPNTTVKRDYGIHRSAEKIRLFLHGCLKKYTEEVLVRESREGEEKAPELKGMTKIFDPLLLDEMIAYNDEGNFDRIIAAELAIALAMKLDPIMGSIGSEGDVRIRALYSKDRPKKGLFSPTRNIFVSNNKLFR